MGSDCTGYRIDHQISWSLILCQNPSGSENITVPPSLCLSLYPDCQRSWLSICSAVPNPVTAASVLLSSSLSSPFLPFWVLHLPLPSSTSRDSLILDSSPSMTATASLNIMEKRYCYRPLEKYLAAAHINSMDWDLKLLASGWGPPCCGMWHNSQQWQRHCQRSFEAKCSFKRVIVRSAYCGWI